MRKRVCGVMLSLFLLIMLFVPTTAFAAENRNSERFMEYSAKIRVESNGDLDIYFSVSASSKMDVLGASKIAVQRYNGSKWVTEYTYTPKNTPELQQSDTNVFTEILVYTPEHKNDRYRAEVTFYAENSTGYSTAVVTTK